MQEYIKIENLLKSNLFQHELIDIDSIVNLLTHKKEISIMYGETYDVYGLTIDSLKYYLILESISRLLRDIGIKVKSVLLVGDSASLINENVKDKEAVIGVIQNNIALIKSLKEKYNLSFEIKVMSEVLKEKKFLIEFNKVSKYMETSDEIKDILNKTVLQNRLKQEAEKGFKYALEEIAIISNYDLKLGPPREQYYDKVSQIFNNKPLGIYVKPTYPLGFNFDYFINHPEIEEFGLTPYKAGSNKLQRNRFILNSTTKIQLEQLLKSTFIPKFVDLPNPLKDLYTICQLSKSIKNNIEIETLFNGFSVKQLSNMLFEEFNEYITE